MKPRGRPKKKRIIGREPRIIQFSPRGRAGRPDEIGLSMDEFEAIRLADYRLLSQQDAAKIMGISQQTFSRILKKARKAVGDAIVNGKIIKIGQPVPGVRVVRRTVVGEFPEAPELLINESFSDSCFNPGGAVDPGMAGVSSRDTVSRRVDTQFKKNTKRNKSPKKRH